MDCKLRAKNCGGCPLLGLDYAAQLKQKEEKVRALRRYIAKRDSTLEAELQKAAQRLYEKVVPAAVQEYISDCEQDEPVRKLQKKPEVPR